MLTSRLVVSGASVFVVAALLGYPCGALAHDESSAHQHAPPPPTHSHPPAHAPAYAPTHGAPAPTERPWLIEPWDPEQPPPDGYHLRSSINGGMLAGGIVLVSTLWLTSIVGGIVAAEDEDEDGIDGDGVEGEDFVPLYIPFVGPFMAISSIETDASATGLLVADGILQVGGLALIIGGILDSNHRAVRYADSGPRVKLSPVVTGEYQGIGLSGSF